MSSYFNQFKKFDPVTGGIPDSPFSFLPSIAARARFLLKTKTTAQIEDMAETIDYSIYVYFEEIRDNEITRLKQILLSPRRFKNENDDLDYLQAMEYFEWDGGSIENGQWIFKDGMEDNLNIATSNNTSEVDVLKDLEEWYRDILQNAPDSKFYELFAVLSLWKLADSLNWLNYKLPKEIEALKNSAAKAISDIESLFNLPELTKVFGTEKEQNLSLAGGCALEAMHAVCYAEHLHSLEKEVTKVMEKQKTELLQAEKIRRKKLSIKLNISRHQKRNEAYALVVDEWSKDANKFASAEKAGIYFSDWLNNKNIEYEPRTVAIWIRAYAKQVGIKFR